MGTPPGEPVPAAPHHAVHHRIHRIIHRIIHCAAHRRTGVAAMRPAFSILLFTVLGGAAQGLVCALALAVLLDIGLARGFLRWALGLAELLLATGLAASFMHLG